MHKKLSYLLDIVIGVTKEFFLEGVAKVFVGIQRVIEKIVFLGFSILF